MNIIRLENQLKSIQQASWGLLGVTKTLHELSSDEIDGKPLDWNTSYVTGGLIHAAEALNGIICSTTDDIIDDMEVKNDSAT